MLLRRLHEDIIARNADKTGEPRTSKRQRFVRFIRFLKWNKSKSLTRRELSPPIDTHNISAPKPANELGPLTTLELKHTSQHDAHPAFDHELAGTSASTPMLESIEVDEVAILSEAQLHTLFSGAPHFTAVQEEMGNIPKVACPWDGADSGYHSSDSLLQDKLAFQAATLHDSLSETHKISVKGSKQGGYKLNVAERPSMLASCGIEPGSVGLAHFLELPQSDSLTAETEDSHMDKGVSDAANNKEMLQTNPERIGIRPLEMRLIYDRLIEFQDLIEAFHDSPGPMTILNNQSSADLYTHLFCKLLTPPGFDGTHEDPTGLSIQTAALIKVLSLRDIWRDFSLVEWRIRLGQILWSDEEPASEHEAHTFWTEQELLLLQITLACELLLRLDALSISSTVDHKGPAQVEPEELKELSKTKRRKIDWDLVLARTFLENILVIRGDSSSTRLESQTSSMLLDASAQVRARRFNIVILPRHQTRSIQGLTRFAETLQWPNTESLFRDLSRKLGLQESSSTMEEEAPSGVRFFEPTTPSAISTYATPLQTPRYASQLLDSYFGTISKPSISSNDSRSLKLPLATPTSSSVDSSVQKVNEIGGWLSRSYLTGLILPGEAISHFLISTLLENDKLAAASLGDSANLYGGFTWANRTWWSKNSIVGRVLACLDDSKECMGWMSCPNLPKSVESGWYSIHSERLPTKDRLQLTDGTDMVALDSAVIPGDDLTSVKADDITLPSEAQPTESQACLLEQWELLPLSTDLTDSELGSIPAGSDIFVASLTFAFVDQGAKHTLSLTHDVYFVTSWPCTPPSIATVPARSASRLRRTSRSDASSHCSHSSSERVETLSRRNSHGFEPLLSHPPTSSSIKPQRKYSLGGEESLNLTLPKTEPINAHPLHKSYSYKVVLVTEVLNPDFEVSDLSHLSRSAMTTSPPKNQKQSINIPPVDDKHVLVLDARGSPDLQLLARAWCAEVGYHALIGRTARTCLACCIREARGLGIHIVIRV